MLVAKSLQNPDDIDFEQFAKALSGKYIQQYADEYEEKYRTIIFEICNELEKSGLIKIFMDETTLTHYALYVGQK